MSERVISDPTVAGWELNPDTGYWMWAAGSEGGGSYDDTEVRGLIATNASNISSNSDRIAALENNTGGGGDSFWVEESPGVIKYTGTAKATDLVAG
jgi:hypothetical protein